MSLVLIDLDGTLIRGPSSESAFVLRLLRERLLGPRQILSGMGFFLRWSPRYGFSVLKKNKAYLSGLSIAAVERQGLRLVEDRLIERVRPFMREQLVWHRKRNDTLVLLSGAPDFIARPMAERLDISHCVATVCAHSDGCFTADPPELHPYGREKLRIAEDLCRRFGCTLEQCTAYADSYSDAALLEKVGRPVTVSPDRALLRAARRAGWTIAPD